MTEGETVGSPPDALRKKFGSLQQRTLKNVLAHRIHKEFPRIGGPRIRQLCAEMILEVLAECMRPREHLTHGQVLWLAVNLHDPPHRHKPLVETDLVPVVLDLSEPADIEARLDRQPGRQRLLSKAVRLCHQAHQQGAVLSNSDLAELLNGEDTRISALLAAYERETEKLVPRRATLHDVGSGLTHKRLICRKRYLEGKEADVVARETYHSLEAVDRYLGQYDRVRHCRLHGLTPQETAHALGCSVRLVKEYLDIDEELEETRR